MLREFFNSQPHEEADSSGNASGDVGCFSTHSLTKRLTVSSRTGIELMMFFNSQPHEEADNAFPVLSQGRVIFQLTASRRG